MPIFLPVPDMYQARIRHEAASSIGIEHGNRYTALLPGTYQTRSRQVASASSTVTGILLDRDSALIHLTFEEVVHLESRPVLGMLHDNFGDKLVGVSITMRGVKCTESMPNLGSFGRKCI